MRLLYDYLAETIKNEKTTIPERIVVFLEQINQDIYGFGAIHIELDEVLPAQEDRVILKALVEKIIQRLKEEKVLDETVSPRIIGGFEEFKNKLM